MTREEFNELLKNTGTDIYSFCYQMTKNRDEADELYQDVWLSAMKQMKQLDKKSNPKSFLLRKAVLLWSDRNKKRKRRNEIAPEIEYIEEIDVSYEQTKSTEDIVMNRQISEYVREEVSKLKDSMRIAVELYYSMELTTEEIGKVLKIPKGTVESRLYNARKILRKRLEDKGYEI